MRRFLIRLMAVLAAVAPPILHGQTESDEQRVANIPLTFADAWAQPHGLRLA
jgi:hypothetical protein